MPSIVDGRWKGTILSPLSAGPMRTSELRRSILEITEKMLIRHPPRVSAGWYSRPAPGEGRSPVRTLLHLELRADTCAGFGGDLRMGTPSFAAYRKDEPSAFPFNGFEQISEVLICR